MPCLGGSFIGDVICRDNAFPEMFSLHSLRNVQRRMTKKSGLHLTQVPYPSLEKENPENAKQVEDCC